MKSKIINNKKPKKRNKTKDNLLYVTKNNIKIGDIVIHNEICFKDGENDIKKNRPCLVLKIEEEYIITCPITSCVESFNKRPWCYSYIPEPLYNNAYSFAKIDNLMKKSKEETFKTGISIKKDYVLKIIDKILEFYQKDQKMYEIKKELGREKCKKLT